MKKKRSTSRKQKKVLGKEMSSAKFNEDMQNRLESNQTKNLKVRGGSQAKMENFDPNLINKNIELSQMSEWTQESKDVVGDLPKNGDKVSASMRQNAYATIEKEKKLNS